MPKNILWLLTDTYRWDNLFDRAENPVRTPELDAFATERAVEVGRFITGSFPTIPHRTDLASGRLGWPHYGWQPLDDSTPNHAAAMLGAAGYRTQLLCDCPHLFNFRFQHAFDAAFQNRGQEGDVHLLHLNDPVERAVPLEKTRRQPQLLGGGTLVDVHRWTNRYFTCEEDTFAARTSRLAVRWLEENCDGGPWFLWLDLFDPHEPWDPPEYLVRRYDPDYDGPPMLHPNYGPSDAYTDAELRNMRAHYAAEAELVDRCIGRILRKIDDLQLWDDTVVVVTSDHGFSIGEHGRAGKTNICEDDSRFWPLYPEVSRVPFLAAGAGLPKGTTADITAQPVDILPTTCELAGVTVDPPQPFQGRSFAAALRGETDVHRDVAVSGCFRRLADGELPEKVTTPFLYADNLGFTPVGSDGSPELYDLESDPGATKNTAADAPETVAELRERLVAHMREFDADDAAVGCWT